MADEPELRVETQPRPDGERDPCRLWFGTRAVDVTAVHDRWLAADHGYYKVSGDDGAVYIVRHDLTTGTWDLALYDAEWPDGPPRA